MFQKLSNLSIFKKQNIKPLMLILVIMVIMGFHPTFAADNTSTLMEQTSTFFETICELASRIRIPLASIAGKFMTNDMVYGSRMHMDQYLWTMRNLTKNFANFGLLGMLLRKIIAFVTGKEKSIQSVITKGLIAGILIQSSWFLVGAVLDLSNIATAAVGSFPMAFIKDNTKINDSFYTEIAKTIQKKQANIDKDGKLTYQKKDNVSDLTSDQIVEMIKPKTDSVGGILVYIGASTLNINEVMNLETKSEKSAKGIAINFGLKAMMLLLYTFTLLMLIVVNIMRVGFLRVVITIAPLLILLVVFKGNGKEKGFLGDITNMGTIMANIFKPALITGMLSIILIFVITIQGMMNNGKNSIDFGGINVSSNSSGANWTAEGIASVTTADKLLGEASDAGKGIFSNIIIYFVTLFLLRTLIKLTVKAGGGQISGAMEKMTSFGESVAQTTPLFKGAGFSAWKAGLDENRAAMFRSAGLDEKGHLASSKKGEMKLRKMFNLEEGRLYDTDAAELRRYLTKEDTTFFDKTKSLMKESGRNLTDQNRKQLLEQWLEKNAQKDNKHQLKEYTKGTPLETYFADENNRTILHTLLGGTGPTPDTFNEVLKKNSPESETKE